MTMRTLLTVVLAVVCAVPVWAGFQEGYKAYERGDYATALKEWRPLAEQGNAIAQYNLGVMYDKGDGVPQHYGEALKWLRLAAEQGNELAQAKMGSMYMEGNGVPQDYMLAYMWFNLAAAQGRTDAASARDALAKRMAPAQVAEAQRLAREWKPKGK